MLLTHPASAAAANDYADPGHIALTYNRHNGHPPDQTLTDDDYPDLITWATAHPHIAPYWAQLRHSCDIAEHLGNDCPPDYNLDTNLAQLCGWQLEAWIETLHTHAERGDTTELIALVEEYLTSPTAQPHTPSQAVKGGEPA